MSTKPDWRSQVSDFSSRESSGPIPRALKGLYLGLLAPPALGLAVASAGPKNNFSDNFSSFILGLLVFLFTAIGYVVYSFFIVKKLGNLKYQVAWWQRLLISIPIFIGCTVTVFGVTFFILSQMFNISGADYIALAVGPVVAVGFVTLLNLRFF